MEPLVVVVGETASGKSALAMDLAKKFNGEIVCADSWTVYKGFDIGTAKPTPEDRAKVPHHLLDVASPNAGYSAAMFKRQAMKAIEDIHSRGKLPILVGGTGLYVDAVIYDYSFLPPSDPAVRQALNAMTLEELAKKAKNMKLDTTGIDMHNKRRVIRLIENNGVRPTRQSIRPNTLILGIKRPADELSQRIEKRIDSMARQGFADEVRRLGRQYGWDIEPMRAPGYRAFADYVNEKISLDQAKQRFRQNDLQLAKKQRTWFKRNSFIQWVYDPKKAVEIATTFLSKQQ